MKNLKKITPTNKKNQKPRPNNSNMTEKSKIIYDTYSVCPRCTLLELKGLEWKDAEVIERNGKVFLNTKLRFSPLWKNEYGVIDCNK